MNKLQTTLLEPQLEGPIKAVLDYKIAVSLYSQLHTQIARIPDSAELGLLETIALNQNHLNINLGNLDYQKSLDVALSEQLMDSTQRILQTVSAGNETLADYHKRIHERLLKSGEDPLTGLANAGRSLEEFIKVYGKAAKYVFEKSGKDSTEKRYIGVISLDFDDFTSGNTTFGHPEMNKVLTAQGQIIKDMVKHDLGSAVRKGGEEFLMFASSTQADGIERLSQKILEKTKTLQHKLTKDGKYTDYTQTASIGYDSIEIDLESAKKVMEIYEKFEQRLKNAGNGDRRAIIEARRNALVVLIKPVYEMMYQNSDDATYDAKVAGKDNVKAFDPVKSANKYYGFVRNLYSQVKANDLSLPEATASAKNYKPS